MKTCLIFSGGHVTGNEHIPSEYSLTISADGGYLNALKLNIIPNICMGDFDTLKTDVNSSCEVIKFLPEKDDTDTLICIKKAISMGCDVIYIYGALGGRFDHTFANVQSLEYIERQGVKGYLIDNQNIVTIQGIGTEEYPHRGDFKYFSIFSLSDKSILSSTGLKYPLDNTPLTRDFPLGVSNEIVESFTTITVHTGLILISYSKD
ncbi:MAG: thiamine diphosphokinase [Oscillospiraceae bacterium]